MNTVQAQRAVQVAGLDGDEEAQLTAAPDNAQRLGRGSLSFDAVVGATLLADLQIACADLGGRQGRCNEIELTDWAHVLAEGRAFEQKIGH